MSDVQIKRAVETIEELTSWGRLVWKASKALGNSETITVGICEINPGCSNPAHSHPNCEEVLHVLQGKIVHSFDGQEVAMRAGDVISIPAGVKHNARNLGPETAILAISFSSAERETVGE